LYNYYINSREGDKEQGLSYRLTTTDTTTNQYLYVRIPVCSAYRVNECWVTFWWWSDPKLQHLARKPIAV